MRRCWWLGAAARLTGMRPVNLYCIGFEGWAASSSIPSRSKISSFVYSCKTSVSCLRFRLYKMHGMSLGGQEFESETQWVQSTHEISKAGICPGSELESQHLCMHTEDERCLHLHEKWTLVCHVNDYRSKILWRWAQLQYRPAWLKVLCTYFSCRCSSREQSTQGLCTHLILLWRGSFDETIGIADE